MDDDARRRRNRPPYDDFRPLPYPPEGAKGSHDEDSFGASDGLVYDSQVGLNRMTGNWWFPFDVFLVPQQNGDVWLYSPQAVGAVYTYDPVTGSYVSPVGAFDVLVSNANGTWTRTTKHGVQWQFNAAGFATSVTDRYGLTMTLHRGGSNQLTGWTDYASRTTNIAYYANGYASSMTDSTGRVWSFTYTAQGYLASITYPSTTYFDRATSSTVTRGRTMSFQYISGTGTARDGNLIQVTDDAGLVAFASTYDTLDRAVSSTNYGRTWNYTYLASGNTKVVDPDGITIEYAMDASGAIASKTVFSKTGLGQAPLRAGEPNSYVWTYSRGGGLCGCGKITTITRPDGSKIEADYDQWGNVMERRYIDAPGGGGATITEKYTWSSFSSYCNLLTYISPEGNAAGGTPADHTTTMTYNALGSLTSVTLPRAALTSTTSHHPVITLTPNSVGKITSIAMPSGLVIDYDYAATTYDLVKITQDPGGLDIVTEFGYDALSRLTSVTTPRGNTTTWTYNAMDEITSIQGPLPLAPEVKYVYDNNGFVRTGEVENKDETGTVVGANPWFTMTYNYSSSNLLSSVVSEVDATTTATTSYTYTTAGRLQLVTDPNGNQDHVEHDERGLVFKTTDGYGTGIAAVTQTDYDLVGRPAAVTDALGRTTTTEYNHVDWPIRRVAPNGLDEQYLWDEDGKSTGAKTYTSGGVLILHTERAFDALGQRTSTTRHLLDASGASVSTETSSREFSTGLRIATETNPRGNSATFTYDAVGRVTKAASPTTDEAVYAYDDDSNVTSVTMRAWNPQTTSFDEVIRETTYDALGRASAQVTRDPSSTISATESVDYDGVGRVLATTDALGNTMAYQWDARGLLTQTTRDLRSGGAAPGAITSSIVTQSTYDLGGRITGRSDGLVQSSSYAYDARDRITTTTDPTAGTSSRVYDAVGNVTQFTDANGSVVSSSYDNMNRVTSRSIARASGVLGTTAESYTYDELGRMLTGVDDDSTVVFTYNSLWRTTSETQGANPLGGGGSTFTYAYNAAGSLSSVQYPSGVTQTRALDAAERLSSTAISGGATLATYTWAGGRVLQVAQQGSVTKTFTHDALWRSTRVKYANTGGTIRDFEYLYNLASQRLLEKRHHAGGAGDLYELDSLYRTVKVKETVADPVAEYNSPGSQTVQATIVPSYDAANNRTNVAVTTSGGTTNTGYTADALNFYTAVGGVTHGRDASGNLTDDGTNLYDYDYRNQLVRVRLKSSGAVIALYDYDALGRRTSKTVGGTTISFLWSGQQMVVESDSSGLVSRRHLGATLGEVVSATSRDVADLDGDSSTTDYVALMPMYDGAFDCVGVLDPAGAVAESYVHSYDGKVVITSGAGTPIAASSIAWQQGYGRMYRDDETGFLYSVFRFYAPAVGRFATRDPVGDWYTPSNLGNGYGWVGSRYRNAFDPLGLDEDSCCAKKSVIIIVDVTFQDPAEFREDVQRAYKRAVGSIAMALLDTDWSIVRPRSRPSRELTGLSTAELRQAKKRWLDHNREERRKLRKLMSSAAKDECFAGIVHAGHAGLNTRGEAAWHFGAVGLRTRGGERIDPHITPAMLRQAGFKKGSLDFLISLACDADIPGFSDFVADPDIGYVATDGDTLWPSGSPSGSDRNGLDVAAEAVRAIRRTQSKTSTGD